MDKNSNDNLDFINSIVNELQPVTPLMSAEKRSILWLTLHTLIIAVLMLLIQPFRSTLNIEITHPQFVLELVLFALGVFATTYFSFLSVVPGAISHGKLKLALVPFLLVCLSLVVSMIFSSEEASRLGARSFCEFEILIFSIAPIMHNLYLIKKGFFVDRKWSLILATTASTMIPAALMHIACQNGALHTIVFHLTPVLIISAVTTFYLSKKLKN